MTKSTREERAERRRAFINYLMTAYGYAPPDGDGDTNAFCKRLYEDGQVDAPSRHADAKPRSAPLLEHLTGKFVSRKFGWHRESNHAIVYVNAPRIGGRQLSIYEMLVVPLELCDPIDADLPPRRSAHKPHGAGQVTHSRKDDGEVRGGWGCSF